MATSSTSEHTWTMKDAACLFLRLFLLFFSASLPFFFFFRFLPIYLERVHHFYCVNLTQFLLLPTYTCDCSAALDDGIGQAGCWWLVACKRYLHLIISCGWLGNRFLTLVREQHQPSAPKDFCSFLNSLDQPTKLDEPTNQPSWRIEGPTSSGRNEQIQYIWVIITIHGRRKGPPRILSGISEIWWSSAPLFEN